MFERECDQILWKVVIAILVCTPVMEVMARGSSASFENTVVQKIKDMLPLIYTQEISVHDEVALGTPISTYYLDETGSVTVSDYISYPVYVNNRIKAIADVIIDENGSVTQVSLGVNFAEELQQQLSANPEAAYSVLYSEKAIYLKFLDDEDNDFICLKSFVGDEYLLNLEVKEEVIDFMKPSPLSSIAFDDAQLPITTRSILFNTLNVSNVNNTSTSCCGGLCWAASIAIMANYHLGTSYTALQIHDRFDCLTSNYHSEEKSYIRDLGMSAGGPYYSTGLNAFSFSTLYDCIEDDMLLLLDLQDYGDGVAHNVVAYGYYANPNASSLYFYYMDPNTGGRISSFPSESSETVYIPLSGHTYMVHCYITAY